MMAGIRRSCRWLLFSFSTLVLATGAFASQSLFSLKIAQPNGAQKAGSELRIRITVTNTSNREITFITSAAQVPEDDFQYELMVRDERGQSAPPSAFMRTRDPRLPMYSGSRIGKSVRPGESFVDEVNVTRFFDLSRPGKYTISVARPNPPRQNLGDGKVQSNSVTVTVVAAVLDLTAQVPSDEQGYYPGLLPGGSGGGATGGWHPGPHDTEFYRLPLTLEILRTTTRDDGALVFEILLRSDGPLPFDLPTSQNLTKIENPANRSRHVFFLQLQPVGGDKNVFVDLGSAATASSPGIPGSSIRIEPGEAMRVLLLGATDQIKRSLTDASGKLQIKAMCNEWILDDNRFFLRGESDVLDSVNAFDFALSDGKPMPVQP